jgi:hypothetical protein
MIIELTQTQAIKNDEDIEAERILIEILEKMRIPFEELELFTTYLIEPQRSTYLSNQITMALLSSDPAGTLQDIVSFIKVFKMRKRIGSYISRNANLDLFLSDMQLVETLKAGKYYRKHENSARN